MDTCNFKEDDDDKNILNNFYPTWERKYLMPIGFYIRKGNYLSL